MVLIFIKVIKIFLRIVFFLIFPSFFWFKKFFKITVIFLRIKRLQFSFLLDFFWLFFCLVTFIRVIILIYRFYYISTSRLIPQFYIFFFLFVLRILILILANNRITLFLGWDGLGVSSYFLVIFYINWKSNNSGLITILSNRIGDSFFIVVILISLIFQRFSFRLAFKLNFSFPIILLFLRFIITKRAQYPFSVWLPLAMAAPTPISALVHSSTLVTARVVILIRFINFLNTKELIFILLGTTLLTTFFSGFLSLNEVDLKKIVALSTLNQLSLIFISIVNRIKFISFFHLNTHALFKRLLFLNVGIFIHENFSNQDKRLFSLRFHSKNFFTQTTLIRRISLIGVSFTSGFFSKDIILENLNFSLTQIVLIIIIIFSISFTFIYTIRIFFRLSKTIFFNKITKFSSFIRTILSILILSLVRVFFGLWFFLNFFRQNFFFFLKIINKSFILTLIFIIRIIISIFFWKNFFTKVYLRRIFLLTYFTFNFTHLITTVWRGSLKIIETRWLEITNLILRKTLVSIIFKLPLLWVSRLVLIFLILFSRKS